MVTFDNQSVTIMQSILMNTSPKKRNRKKRATVAITYRLAPTVKNAVTDSALSNGRSENAQAEFLLKIGYLREKSINTLELSDAELLEKFEEIANQIEFSDEPEGEDDDQS